MAALSISLHDIPPEGMRVSRTVGAADLQLAEDDPGIKDVLALTADVRVDDAGIVVDGELTGVLVHDCVRCLESFDAPVTVSFLARYRDKDKRGAAAGNGGGERNGGGDEEDAEAREMDEYPVVMHRVELLDVLREHLIVSTPMQPLCAEGCRGLCQVCGRNLNVTECGCDARTTTSPFAVLSDMYHAARNTPAS